MEGFQKVLNYFNVLEDSDEYKIVCPFHEDINASLLINLKTETFFCFGCLKAGNAYDFVRYVYPKKDELSALFKYHRILKSKKNKNFKTTVRKPKDVKTSKEEYEEAYDYYAGLGTTKWKKVRSKDDIDIYNVKQYMRDRGFTSATLEKVKAKYNYNKSYPIVFAMFDLGKFKGWVCRTTNRQVEKKRKYLYNKGFSRSSTLVGNYSNKRVVLVEGFMDYLKMKQFGVKHVAAILGWKITPKQIEKLKQQGVTEIISALDNDKCGIKGTNYLKGFFNVIRFQFPKGAKDPGMMNKKTYLKAKKQTLRRHQTWV